MYSVKRDKPTLKLLYKTKYEAFPNLKKILHQRNLIAQKKKNKEKEKLREMHEKEKQEKLAEEMKIKNAIDAFDNHSIDDSSDDSDGFL